MTEQRTQFDYLLNAFERASQANNPAEHGYGEKRRALFAYVRELEAKAGPVAQPANTDSVPGSPLGSGARPSEQEQGVSSIVLGAEGEQ